MKKYIYNLLTLLLTLNFYSCKKDNVAVDKEPLIAATYSRFVQINNSGYLKRNVPVKETNNKGLALEIGITNISNQDRTVELEYKSNTAVKGVNYFAPNSVIIPAGKSIGTMTIVGDYNYYKLDELDTVKIRIKPSSSIPTLAGRDSLMVILQAYCDVVDPNDFNLFYSASYTVGPSGLGDVVNPPGGYGVQIDSLGMIKTTATSSIGTIDGMHNITGDTTVYFKMDWEDPSNPNITIDPQFYYKNQAGAIRWVRTTPGRASTFNACKKTMEIFIDVYQPATSTTAEVSVASGRWIHVEF